MKKSLSFDLESVRGSWAIQNPGRWVDAWRNGKISHEPGHVIERVASFNEVLTRAACLAITSGDRNHFMALREASTYAGEEKDLWGQPSRWCGQPHLDVMLGRVVLKLINTAPEGLLFMKEWGLLCDGRGGAVEQAARSVLTNDYHSQQRWNHGWGHPLRADELLFCLCKTNARAEAVSRQLFPDVEEGDISFSRAVGHLDTYEYGGFGAPRKLTRMVKRLGAVASLPLFELEQWVTLQAALSGGGRFMDLEGTVFKEICKAFKQPFTEAGALEYLTEEVKRNPGLKKIHCVEETYLFSVLKVALSHGAWDFSEKSRPEKGVGNSEGYEPLEESMRNVILNVYLKHRHSGVLGGEKREALAL